MHLPQHQLCTRKTELTFEVRCYLDVHKADQPRCQGLFHQPENTMGTGWTLTNASDVKYVLPRCGSACGRGGRVKLASIHPTPAFPMFFCSAPALGPTWIPSAFCDNAQSNENVNSCFRWRAGGGADFPKPRVPAERHGPDQRRRPTGSGPTGGCQGGFHRNDTRSAHSCDRPEHWWRAAVWPVGAECRVIGRDRRGPAGNHTDDYGWRGGHPGCQSSELVWRVLPGFTASRDGEHDAERRQFGAADSCWTNRPGHECPGRNADRGHDGSAAADWACAATAGRAPKETAAAELSHERLRLSFSHEALPTSQRTNHGLWPCIYPPLG